MSSPPVKISQSLSICVWRALREEGRPEADLLASAIIGSGHEPHFDCNEEGLDFYREYLITHGLVEAVDVSH